MIRILIVADPDGGSQELAGQLQRGRSNWSVTAAADGPDALRQIEAAPFDVVVAPMAVRGMDGAELLQQVRRRQPHAARLVVGAQTSVADMHRVMALAHQVLGAGNGGLERAIERLCSLLRRRDRPGVQRALAMRGRLPVLPRIYWELAAEMERPQASSASVAAIIDQDPAITARVLQLANSAYFGVRRQVRSVRDAATVLGLEPLRSIALMAGLSRVMHKAELTAGFSLEALQSQAAHVAALAASMLNDPEESKTAYSAGMLHHIGYLLLAVNLPEEYEALRQEAFDRHTVVERIELDKLGCDHAEIGAHALTLWGLPLPLVEAVACHHRPSSSGEVRFGAATAVHVAAVLADEAAGRQAGDAALEWPFLQRLGADGPVARWRRGEPIRPF